MVARRVDRPHRLGDVIVIAICAIIANANGPTAIAKWATLNATPFGLAEWHAVDLLVDVT